VKYTHLENSLKFPKFLGISENNLEFVGFFENRLQFFGKSEKNWEFCIICRPGKILMMNARH